MLIRVVTTPSQAVKYIDSSGDSVTIPTIVEWDSLPNHAERGHDVCYHNPMILVKRDRTWNGQNPHLNSTLDPRKPVSPSNQCKGPGKRRPCTEQIMWGSFRWYLQLTVQDKGDLAEIRKARCLHQRLRHISGTTEESMFWGSPIRRHLVPTYFSSSIMGLTWLSILE